MWRSLVAHRSGGPGVAGSKPAIPTITRHPEKGTTAGGFPPAFLVFRGTLQTGQHSHPSWSTVDPSHSGAAGARRDPVRPDVPVPPPVSGAVVTVPNLITFSRLLLMPVCAWLLATEWLAAGIVLTGLVAATDWLDGWVARRTRAVSRIGQLMDPLADRFLLASVALALAWRGALPWLAVALLVGRDLVLLAGFQWLQRRGVRPPEVIWLGKTATAILLTSLPVLALGETGIPGAWLIRLAGLAALWVGLAVYYAVGVIYTRIALAQLRQLRHPSG